MAPVSVGGASTAGRTLVVGVPVAVAVVRIPTVIRPMARGATGILVPLQSTLGRLVAQTVNVRPVTVWMGTVARTAVRAIASHAMDSTPVAPTVSVVPSIPAMILTMIVGLRL